MGSGDDVNAELPLGGWLPGLDLSAAQTEILNAIADEIIPGGEGFPAPSSVGIGGFFKRYVTPEGQEATWFPFLGETEFKARLDALGTDFARASSAWRVAILNSIERDEPEYFARLRDTIYLGYYSRPEVVHAINATLPAGRHYRTSPQPRGYSDVMSDWDRTLLDRVRGGYLRTEEVKPVSLEESEP